MATATPFPNLAAPKAKTEKMRWVTSTLRSWIFFELLVTFTQKVSGVRWSNLTFAYFLKWLGEKNPTDGDGWFKPPSKVGTFPKLPDGESSNCSPVRITPPGEFPMKQTKTVIGEDVEEKFFRMCVFACIFWRVLGFVCLFGRWCFECLTRYGKNHHWKITVFGRKMFDSKITLDYVCSCWSVFELSFFKSSPSTGQAQIGSHGWICLIEFLRVSGDFINLL